MAGKFKARISDVLSLETLDKDIAPDLFRLIEDNRTYLREWLPWLDANTRLEDTIQFIDSIQPNKRDDGGFVCGVFIEGELKGMCGFHEVNSLNHSVSIGYWLSQNAHGKGYITQSVEFLINYAFEEIQLNKVLVFVAQRNLKSRAVCERLGLHNEGVERQGEFLYDKYVDLVRYSVLNSEWCKNGNKSTNG